MMLIAATSTHGCRFGKAVCNRFATKPPKNSLLPVPAGA